jgi:hypothetical protein
VTVAPEETTSGTDSDEQLAHAVCPVCHPPETATLVRALCGTEFDTEHYDHGPAAPSWALVCVVCVDLIRSAKRCPRCGTPLS